MNRIEKLKRTALLVMCLALITFLFTASSSFARDKFIVLPPVSGTLLNNASEPIEFGLVVVTLLGSHQKAETFSDDIFKLSVIHDMTDERGVFSLAGENVPLVDSSGKKAYLVGCRIEVTQADHLPLRMDLANLSDSNSGTISIFLNSALQHEGSFFGAISAGFDAIRTHSFIPQYLKSLSQTPLIMTEKDVPPVNEEASDTLVNGDSYSAAVVNRLYEVNKRNDLKAASYASQKINRFRMLYND